MVIYIDEYLNRRHMLGAGASWLAKTAGLASLRGHPLCAGHPPRMTPSAYFLGSAALALPPDAITLPPASDLGLVYAEASLI